MFEKVHNFLKGKKVNWLVLWLIFSGIIIRSAGLGDIPAGFNQDEAFAGYEAFSLMNYGVDSAGYHNPCYFVSWGSGMNVLESYLAIPFMKLFGVSVIALRLPQLIFSCISLVVFYFLMKRIFSYKTALMGLGLLVISPWHIMLSRWGLESNLAQAFLLMGLYFFIRGVTDNRYFILSAITYGLSLYSYSITWVVVPLALIFFGLYIIISKQKISSRYTLISCVILFIIALPLILFVLVNKDVIPEITTRFISIPKLLGMRTSEISLKNLKSPKSYYNLINMLINQDDGLIWNSAGEFGMFYKISMPFIIIGLTKIITVSFKSLRQKVFNYEAIIFAGMISSVITCILIENININKSNSLHFYTLIFLTIGLREIFVILKKHPVIPKSILCAYGLSFIFFLSFYFGYYNERISETFRDGVQEAIQYVKEHNFENIYVDSSIYYPQVLFFDQTPHDVFKSTVIYTNYPSAYLDVQEFGNYRFGIDYDNLESDKVYILKNDRKQNFMDEGFQIVEFGQYAVAFK